MLSLIRNAGCRLIVLLMCGWSLSTEAQVAMNNALAHGNPKLFSPNQPAPFAPAAPLPPQEWIAGRDYVKDRLLIKTKIRTVANTLKIAGRLTASDRLNNLLASQGVVELTPVYRSNSPTRATLDASGRPMEPSIWHRATLRSDSDVPKVAETLSNDLDIERAEPDFLLHLADSPAPGLALASSIQPSSLPTSGGDPLLAQQWHLDAINAREAWAYLQSLGLPPGGSHNVIVAVIDSGVDYNHPDLAGNIWTNPQEISGNGKDDDNNGIIDDVRGANFVGTHSGDPMDDNGHGTHVAGIIAAQAGNGIGGVGIAYNVQILPIKAADSRGVLTASDTAEAIQYAAAKQADVINMSFASPLKPSIVEEAMAAALNQAVLVAAAGNQHWPNVPYFNQNGWTKIYGTNYYPAAYTWVLGVMSSDQDNKLFYFSNWDYIPEDENEYEVMAPGVGIWSCLPNNQYAAWSGTSMSAPVVSGIAALLRTKYSDRNQYSSRFIMGQIASTAIPKGNWKMANAIQALTQDAKPKISVVESRVFDSSQTYAGNDQDANIDAGETVDLAIILRNRWGKANQITAKLQTQAGLLPSDPYVTMITDTVEYGAMGTFATADNGITRDASNVIAGVQYPFRFSVSSQCPNTYLISFLLTLTCRYGTDPGNLQTVVTTKSFNLPVQRGNELPKTIVQDTTLTKDRFWIVPDFVLVPAGVTLRIEPGTRVQFGGRLNAGAYQNNPNPSIQVEGRMEVEGTAAEPVEIFGYINTQNVVIKEAFNGVFILKYARVDNGYDLKGTLADHCSFTGITGSGFKTTSNTTFYNQYSVSGGKNIFINNQFYLPYVPKNSSQGIYYPSDGLKYASGNVFNHNGGVVYRMGIGDSMDPSMGNIVFVTNVVINGESKTYGLLPQCNGTTMTYDMVEALAREYGGHLADITSAAENEFIKGYMKTVCSEAYFNSTHQGRGELDWTYYNTPAWIIGLNQLTHPGIFTWTSGASTNFTAWQSGGPYYSGDYVCFTTEFWGPASNYGAYPCLVEIPGVVSPAQLYSMRNGAMEKITGTAGHFRHNAILNSWFGDNINQWTRPEPGGWQSVSPNSVFYAVENYWGTTSRMFIDAAIKDFKDDFRMKPLLYEPILTNAPADCFPFVEKVLISTAGEADTTIVGAELVTFRVVFNRDMDPSIQPHVSFGPAMPFTDFTVSGAWEDARTWKGIHKITPITGDGYQYIRIAGGVAAGDPWLVTGEDVRRFRFQVRTVGTLSMNLQAHGASGHVSLNWSQDDYELLAGYNLYRSANPSNSFVQLNKTVIPPSQTSFEDASTSPGKTYYYRFTVAMTDMTESGFSNTADATPLDTIPPTISHRIVVSASPGLPLVLDADVTDNVSVLQVDLFFRTAGAATYSRQTLIKTKVQTYSAMIEGAKVQSPGMDYYIEASDGVNIARVGSAEAPKRVTIADSPTIIGISPQTGPASGGTPVNIAGVNFKTGAVVIFGGTEANNVVWVSDQLLTCRTPSKAPGSVDVQVKNPNGLSHVLSRGFVFVADAVGLSLPKTTSPMGDILDVPLSVANASGLVSANIMLTFNPSVVRIRNAQLGGVAAGWALTVNTNIAGQISLSVVGPGSSISGDGILAILECQAVGTGGSSCPIAFSSVSLNGGTVAAQPSSGTFAIDSTFVISGSIRYWNGSAAVSNVLMTLRGNKLFQTTNDTAGSFQFSSAPKGSYTLVPGKVDQAYGISAYDASLVLQQVTGLTNLSALALRAADVDQNGKVDAMDAFYILQKSVGAIDLPFPKSDAIWVFNPAELNVNNSWGDMPMRNFTAILLGDVSGNWNSSGVAAGLGLAPKPSTSGGISKTGAVVFHPSSLGRPALDKAVLMAVYRSPSEKEAQSRIRFRSSDQPIDSVELLLSGAAHARCTVPNFIQAVQLTDHNELHCAMAGASSLMGTGDFMVVDLVNQADNTTILAAEVNEGTTPVRILERNASVDSDNDGQDDWTEVVCGTDPGDPQSAFKIRKVELLGSDGGCRICWSTVPGRSYALEKQTTAGSDWLRVGIPITAAGADTSAVDSGGRAGQQFYRVRLAD